MKSKTISASAFMLCIGAATAAQASCIQADAAGTWQAYSMNSNGEVTRCKLMINSSGVIANNTCTQYYSSGSINGTMTNGKVNLIAGSTCTFAGSFVLGGTLNTIRHLTLSKGKTTGDGIGTFGGGSFSFTLDKL